MVRDIAGQIIASGYVTSFTHAALGAGIATLTSQGGVLGGARIWAVIPGAASGRAGLSAADTIRPAGPAPAPIAEGRHAPRTGRRRHDHPLHPGCSPCRSPLASFPAADRLRAFAAKGVGSGSRIAGRVLRLTLPWAPLPPRRPWPATPSLSWRLPPGWSRGAGAPGRALPGPAEPVFGGARNRHRARSHRRREGQTAAGPESWLDAPRQATAGHGGPPHGRPAYQAPSDRTQSPFR